MGRKTPYNIDLNLIEGDGNFPCPSCGTSFSPEDENGESYNIIDVKMAENNVLERLTIKCKKCSSVIKLEGFGALKEIDKLK
jgi:phage terminase large subunit GpA-like protein